MYKILMVEDDSALAAVMKKQITAWNYDVHCMRDFKNILPEFQAYQPHLVLLDIMLPFFNGYHWCTEIRKQSRVPIVFLSSASDNMNIVMIAKMQAILRRTYCMTEAAPVLEHRGAVLNLDDATLTYQGQQIDLTKNEFRILRVLLENKGKVVERDTLMIQLWQNDCYVEENTLTVNVTRLRKKLEQYQLSDFIKTKVGRGYLIE